MNDKHNIIFLDIDGVLNGYSKWNVFGWRLVNMINYKPLINWYRRVTEPFGIHERKVKRLAKIVKATNAKIVMSSSWRHDWWKKPYEKQYKDQKQLTDLLNKYDIEIIDITPKLITDFRGDEIRSWLQENKSIVRSFIILDDEAYGMSPYKHSFRFIQTSDVSKNTNILNKLIITSGLKRKHVKQAIKILQFKIINFY